MQVTGSPSTKHAVFVVPCTLDPTYPASEVLTTLPAGTAADPIATSDAGPAWTTARAIVNSADASGGVVSLTAAPTTGQKIVVDDLLISTDTALSVTFKEETSGTVIRGPIYLAANSTAQITLRGKTKLPVANKKLQFITSVAGNITVEASYHSEA